MMVPTTLKVLKNDSVGEEQGTFCRKDRGNSSVMNLGGHSMGHPWRTKSRHFFSKSFGGGKIKTEFGRLGKERWKGKRNWDPTRTR